MQAGKGRPDLLPVDVILELSAFFEAGCQKYGDRNWESGIPTATYFNSAVRHLFKMLRGDIDERHDMAALWNVACLIQTRKWIAQGILPAWLENMPKARQPNTEGSK